jgi:acyl transferase domain-containing protein
MTNPTGQNDIDAHADIDTHIAVIGMACRLPGAAGPERFWANLVGGVDSVRAITAAELATWGVDPGLLDDQRYVPAHGVVDGVGEFDADFFGYSARDADMLNPQNQMFLECAWEAMEQAGYDPVDVPGPVGVFGGAGRNGYGAVVTSRIDDLFPGVDELAVHVANEPEHLCTRVAYQLGLTGPAITVLTTCSSSLVAVHEAVRALQARCHRTGTAGRSPPTPGESSAGTARALWCCAGFGTRLTPVTTSAPSSGVPL